MSTAVERCWVLEPTPEMQTVDRQGQIVDGARAVGMNKWLASRAAAGSSLSRWRPAPVVAAVGASSIGQSMDELISLVTLAVETGWPVSRLQHVVAPFPTLSQLVGHAFQLLVEKTSPRKS